MPKPVLLVEPDYNFASVLAESVRELATLDHHVHFETARKQILTTPLALLVANVRLGAYNGLYLVYLAITMGAPVRSIVYTERRDPVTAREVQRAGAFYEIRDRLPTTLEGYLPALLPSTDRRDPGQSDRRAMFRGGRRCWDLRVLHRAR